ncbi:hypothetical protein RHMOL_Rhmol08G0057800 [Rhododendron molle]|uniref:Uncharacterized protein n=1 Tax=Rhododendron molle TaxID=49168 RepID=A0ACC0MKA3_RHOML|nr:hypothetical protein RHMOL_Rhmol08G0057800 [Rhododendron molle]
MDRILCDELLEEVLRRLPPRSTFSPSAADVSLVSKRWLRLYRSSVSDVSLSLSVDNCTPPSLSSFLPRFPHLSFLKITTAAHRSVTSDIPALRYRILSPDDISAFAEQVLLSVASSCPKLTESFQFAKLDLGLPFELEDNHLLAVAEKFRGLLSLRLDNCCLVTGEGLKTMALAMSNNLEELALRCCKVEPGLLTILGQSFRNLRKLDLSFSDILADKEFISMLASCNCLRELKVRGCDGSTRASVVSMFRSCKQLESVDIMCCSGIDSEAVELFVLCCASLREIHVEECKLSDISRSWASIKFVRLLFDW